MHLSAGVNTYATTAEADGYAEDRAWADWSALQNGDREIFLYDAAIYLDATYDWIGRIADQSQAMGWPRLDAYDKEGRAITGIPTMLKYAQIELARLRISGPLIASQTQGDVSKVRADTVEVTFRTGSQVTEPARMALVNRYLDQLIDGSLAGSNIMVTRA